MSSSRRRVLTAITVLAVAVATVAAAVGSPALHGRAAETQIPVHYLEDQDVPASYQYFILDNSGYDPSKVQFTGKWFDQFDANATTMLTRRYPLSKDCKVIFPSVGTWTDGSGNKHSVDMTVSIVDWNGFHMELLYANGWKNPHWWFHGPDFYDNVGDDANLVGQSIMPDEVTKAMGSPKMVTSGNQVSLTTLKASFSFSDGSPVPDTFQGVVGFNDIDGFNATEEHPDDGSLKAETVVLKSGFDGAYLLKNNELERYGTNGFAGTKRDAGNEQQLNSGAQPLHRVAATWTGSSFTFSWGGTYRMPYWPWGYHTVFGAPIKMSDLKWTVTAKAVDKRTGSVLKTVETGKVVRLGDRWGAYQPPTIDGYRYIGLKGGSAPLSGQVTYGNLGNKDVVMEYAKLHSVTGRYVDGDGKEIKPSSAVATDVVDGDKWQVTPPEIPGYTYKGVQGGGGTNGTVDGSDVTVTMEYARNVAGLSVEKSYVVRGHEDDLGYMAKAGDVIEWSVKVTNTGNVTLAPVTVTDAKLGLDGKEVTDSLAPGKSETVPLGAHEVSADEYATSYSLSNIVTAMGVPPAGTTTPKVLPSTSAVPLAGSPAIKVEESAKLATDSDGDGLADAGDAIVYSIRITNTGDKALAGITVSDEMLGISGLALPGTLAPGESVEVPAGSIPSHVVTVAEALTGGVSNVASAKARTPDGKTLEGRGEAVMKADAPVARLSVKKSYTVRGHEGDKEYDAVPGDVIDYAAEVSNDGSVPVSKVMVSDAMTGLDGKVVVDSLEPGEGRSVPLGSHEVGADDVATGKVVNEVKAMATAPDGMDGVEASDSVSTNVRVSSGTAADALVQTGDGGTALVAGASAASLLTAVAVAVRMVRRG